MKKEMWEWLKTIALALVIALLITVFVKPTIVKNHSMSKTLEENDFLMINRLFYQQGEPEEGDIIVFRSPLKNASGQEKLLIKRVIALPGDEITIREGHVWINGYRIEEPYLEDSRTFGDLNVNLPQGQYFVMGDNRSNSLDSRDQTIGLVQEEDIIGKAFLRIFPLNRIGFLQ